MLAQRQYDGTIITKNSIKDCVIPHKIQLKNFLSYGSELQTIDFTPYHLICLSGKNGHGKSALLDAITWALWGQARKTAGTIKADQGLLRLGQTQMLVIFDFEFNGQLYRIRREFMQTYGKPYATLEFGLLDPTTDTLIPLTDKTIRATQSKIDQTLHLDFNSFTNSAFLRQGNANEFSKKSPRDRKQILASILGLDQYEKIRKLASERVKTALSEKNVLCTLQEKRNEELQYLPEIQKNSVEIGKKINALKKQERDAHNKQKKLGEKHKEIVEAQKKQALLTFQLEQLEQEKQKTQEQLRKIFNYWRTIRKRQRKSGNKKKLKDKKEQIHDEIDQHQKCFAHNLEIKEQLLKTKETIQQLLEQQSSQNQERQLTNQRLAIEQQNIEKNIQELQLKIDAYTKEQQAIKQEQTTLETARAQINLNREQLKHDELQFEKRKATYHQFTSLGNWLANELKNLTQKKHLVHEEQKPSCPLCEQNLSASRRRFLKVKFNKQENVLHHRMQRLQRIIPKLKQILIDQHQQISASKKDLEEQQLITLKITELQKAYEKQEKQIEQLPLEKRAHDTTLLHIKQQQENQLKQQATTHNDKQLLTLHNQKQNLEHKLKNNIYNPTDHKQAIQYLGTIEKELQASTNLDQEIAQQDERKKQIQELCTILKTIKNKKNGLKQKIEEYKTLPNTISALKQAEQALEKEQKEIVQQKETLLQAQARLETQEQHLDQIKKEYTEQKKYLSSLDNTIADYQTIATATGKDGIQALLIEDAIPEIEQEANDLLAKLTNNQAHIFIESLRDLKKGGTKETLDIKISDSVGIRPYELFSGGEAFRIDFALRIAISKLLARRAGTALQTLIIDEGFGSQDEEGLANIMDAIYKIQDDFSKIIVVSHLDTMKDQFPVHFVVEKNPQGSNVTVIEHG